MDQRRSKVVLDSVRADALELEAQVSDGRASHSGVNDAEQVQAAVRVVRPNTEFSQAGMESNT